MNRYEARKMRALGELVEELEGERDAARQAAEAFAVWLGPDERSKVASVAIEYASRATMLELARALDVADGRIAAAAISLREEDGK